MSAVLIGDHLDLEEEEHLLWIECGHGAVPLALARLAPSCHFTLLNSNTIASSLLAYSLQLNGITNGISVQMPETLSRLEHPARVVALQLPKGRKFARRLLSEIYHVLSPQGWLYLSGSNQQGIKSVNADAYQLFGNESLITYRKGHRLTRYQKLTEDIPKPEWYVQPGISPASWQRVHLRSPKGEHFLASMPGIFSCDFVDPGTQFLLDNLEVRPSDIVLDLGCGYGVIGIYAALCGADCVDMVDINSLAIQASIINVANLSLTNVKVFDLESFQTHRRYSLIVSNPPFHQGYDTEYHTVRFFIQLSSTCLEKQGKLLLVANRFLPYENLLHAHFKHAKVRKENTRYRIWEAWQ